MRGPASPKLDHGVSFRPGCVWHRMYFPNSIGAACQHAVAVCPSLTPEFLCPKLKSDILWALCCLAACGRQHMAEQDKGFILCGTWYGWGEIQPFAGPGDLRVIRTLLYPVMILQKYLNAVHFHFVTQFTFFSYSHFSHIRARRLDCHITCCAIFCDLIKYCKACRTFERRKTVWLKNRLSFLCNCCQTSLL